jgi:hypothetical protein
MGSKDSRSKFKSAFEILHMKESHWLLMKINYIATTGCYGKLTSLAMENHLLIWKVICFDGKSMVAKWSP